MKSRGSNMLPAHHNGNQESVYAAVRAGKTDTAAIMRATGLDGFAVHNALRRLRDAGRIHVSNGHYTAITQCLLAEVWR